MPRYDPPAGVTPLDRRLPSAPTLADIPSRLAWLRDYYGGHTAIGTAITDRATGTTYRVDSETLPYVPFTPDGAYPDPSNPHGIYTLTPFGVDGAAIQAIVEGDGLLILPRLDTRTARLVYPTRAIQATEGTATLRGKTLPSLILTEKP